MHKTLDLIGYEDARDARNYACSGVTWSSERVSDERERGHLEQWSGVQHSAGVGAHARPASFMAFSIVEPICAGDEVTTTPALCSASIFCFAPPYTHTHNQRIRLCTLRELSFSMYL